MKSPYQTWTGPTHGVWLSGWGSSFLNQWSRVRSSLWVWGNFKSLGQLSHLLRCLKANEVNSHCVRRLINLDLSTITKGLFSSIQILFG
jgi:hypothetical protein